MEKMLADKTCLVTGAGRGIGKGVALLFAREGGRVVVNDLDEDPVNEVVAEIEKAGGIAVACAGDVMRVDFPDKLIQTAVNAFGPSIDVIVNNAGFTWDSVVHKMTDEQWEAMWKVHVTAPFRIIRAAAPYIREAAKKEKALGKIVSRKIINVSSLAGINGNPGQANYAAAKAGVIGLTKTLAKEWGQFAVCVNAVAFGIIETRLTQPKENAAVLRYGAEDISLGIPEAQRVMIKMRCPLQRAGTPEEAAGGILFLASPLADYVSGQVLNVSGGL